MALSAEERPRRRFTVDDVLEMVRAGILGEDEHVELIDGELIAMSPQGRPHMLVTIALRRRLEKAYEGRAYTADHSPLRVDAHHLPEPDIVVYRGDLEFARDAADDDPLLVVEIAATSLRHDEQKAALYARRGVPVYWLVDLARRQLRVHERPSPDGYRTIRLLNEDEPVAVPDTGETWTVADVLPPPGV